MSICDQDLAEITKYFFDLSVSVFIYIDILFPLVVAKIRVINSISCKSETEYY